MVAAPWRYSTLGHSISVAAPAAAGNACGLEFPEPPENQDFTRLANEAFDDGGADAVGEGAGGGLSPVRLGNEEHPASATAPAAATPASRQPAATLPFPACGRGKRAGNTSAVAVRRLRLLRSIMRNPCFRAVPALPPPSASRLRG